MILWWHVWGGIVQSTMTAIAGLGGVLIGAWMTGRNQKEERRVHRLKAQLDEFYAPLFGMRLAIKSKSELRLKLHEIAGKAWADMFLGISHATQKQQLHDENWPRFEALHAYSERQLREELIPLYRQMVDLFTKKMALSEPSTRNHYGTLVEFVEIWNRHLADPLPTEVALEVDHSEKSLYPFYEDLQLHFEWLTKVLKEGRLQ